MKMLIQMVFASSALASVWVTATGQGVNNSFSLHDTKMDMNRGGKFFFKHSSTTRVRLVTVTKHVFSTCYSLSPQGGGRRDNGRGMDFNDCNGRKRNRNIVQQTVENETNLHSIGTRLESSFATEEDTRKRSGRVLTFWTTDYSTLTVTTKSFIPGTTVTVRIKCTIPGFMTTDSCGYFHFD